MRPLASIAKATDWQNHSIREFLSAQVTKKMKLKVESTKNILTIRWWRARRKVPSLRMKGVQRFRPTATGRHVEWAGTPGSAAGS